MKFGFGAHGWVRSVFRKEVAISGEVPCPKFLIPVVLSQSGLILRVGQIVVLDESGALAALKEIWILPHEDHKTVLSLVSIGSTESTTFQVRLDDLDLSPGLRQDKPQFLRSVLNEGQNSLLIHLCHPSYPVSVRRILRKHQITALIRWNIQQILAGFELSKKFHLGPADFAHDPHIFGLEPSTLFVYEYQVEEYSTHHSLMDILLRPHWDFRSIAANAAFRVVVTLRLWIDSDCHLQGFIHAQQCNREIPPEELEATPWLHRGIFLAQDPSPIPSKDFSAGSNSERARAEQLNWTGDDLDVAPMIAPTFSLEYEEIIEDLVDDADELTDGGISSAEDVLELLAADPGDPLASSSFHEEPQSPAMDPSPGKPVQIAIGQDAQGFQTYEHVHPEFGSPNLVEVEEVRQRAPTPSEQRPEVGRGDVDLPLDPTRAELNPPPL